MIKIAVDAMGGDFAPEEIVLGAINGAREYGCEIYLVGDETRIREALQKAPGWDQLPVHIVHASETIEMHDQPGAARNGLVHTPRRNALRGVWPH